MGCVEDCKGAAAALAAFVALIRSDVGVVAAIRDVGDSVLNRIGIGCDVRPLVQDRTTCIFNIDSILICP